MKRASTFVISALLIATSVARADPPAEAGDSPAAIARTYFLAGQAAYQSTDYAAAAVALEQASRALPDPRTTFSLAQAYRQLFLAGHDPAYAARAAELYNAYLHDVPRGGRSDDAREFSANLGTLVELAQFRDGATVVPKSVAPHTQLMVWSPVAGARAAIDGGESAAVPIVVDAAAGAHKVDVTADHYDAAHVEVVAVDGRLVAVEVQLRAKPATIEIHAPRDARVLVDEVDVVDSGHGIAVPPGHHRVWIGERGHIPAHTELDVSPGGRQTVALPLQISARRQHAHTALYAAGAVAAVALGAFAYAEWEAHDAHDLLAIRDNRDWTVAQAGDYQSSRTAALRWADVSIGVAAGAMAVAGLGLYLYYADSPEAPRRTVLTPTLDAGGAGVALSSGF